MSEQEVWDIQNIGTKSFAEIKDKLRTYLAEHPLLTQPMPPVVTELASSMEKPQLSPPSLSLSDPTVLNSAQEKGIQLDQISVERLALSESLQSLLRRASVKTIGELAQQPRDKWKQWVNIIQRLNTYLTWLIKQDETVWADEIVGRDISPLYRLELNEASLEGLAKKWLSPLSSKREQVVRWRYGLDGEQLTLEQVGEKLDVSRERVRQIQYEALRTLKEPRRRAVIRPLLALLVYLLEQAGGLMNETQVETALRREMVIGNVSPVGVVRLLFELDEGLKWVRKAQAWGLTWFPLAQVPSINRQLAGVLKRAYAPLSLDRVIANFKAVLFYQNRRDELNDTFINACLRTHPEIEIDDEDMCALTKWASKRLDEMILALRQLGEPAHYSVIAEQTNALLPPDQQASTHTIHAHMQRLPDIFVRVGHGIYGLAEWGLHDDGSLANAAQRVLSDAGRPLHYETITDQVLETWQVQRTSVYATLTGDDRFVSIGSGVYWLRERMAAGRGAEKSADFGDLFGAQLEHWQKDWDRRQGNVELDTQTEVDTIRRIGLDFFND